MIDYQKLKVVHELAIKLPYARFIYKNNYHDEEVWFGVTYAGEKEEEGIFMQDIDELIETLKELTNAGEPKPKYKVGDEVFFLGDFGNTLKFIINGVDADSEEKYYSYEIDEWFLEEQLYPSKLALIEAQIEHWTELKNEEKSIRSDNVSMQQNCPHESQTPDSKDNVHMCIKCFEEFCMPDACLHESDGKSYLNTRLGMIAYDVYCSKPDWHYKCTKCGEFYK